MSGTVGPVGIFRADRVRDAFELTAAAVTVEPPDTPTSALGNIGMAGDGSLYMIEDLMVTRAVAMSVPAYRRAKVLVASTLATLRLDQYDANGNRVPSIPFLRQPDPGRVRSAVFADLYADLADYGVGYWRNPNWSSPDGWRYPDAKGPARKHKSIVSLPAADVVDVDARSYRVMIDGVERTLPAEAVIGFECMAGAWLGDGARAIGTSRMHTDAIRLYAKTPTPTTVIKNNGPRKTAEQVAEVVESVESARRSRSTAYVGRDIELDKFGYDAQQTSLIDFVNADVLDIARVTGIPALYLSQGISDSSMTYVTTTQQRLDLHAALLPFATAVEERLSFDDVTGGGVRVEHDFTPFLRVDPKLRADIAAALVPIGVYTVEEARAIEGFVRTEGIVA